MGSARETEKIVRLGLPRIIRLKENAPELDYRGLRFQEHILDGKVIHPTPAVGHDPGFTASTKALLAIASGDVAEPASTFALPSVV
jgi:hypothetical protein